jgi:3-methylcrotonyl-CoA carboxylase alpha subunit
MFDSLLIANRGEIACRVIRTARRMGIHTVAVYSDADADALHVAMADAAERVGPAPAAESYLDVDAILEAARRSGAQAVHPGYGFLAENADFAAACAAAGLVFVGPPPEAMRAMGSKSAARAIMAKSGVPLVPGYHGKAQSEAAFAKAAAGIGYPVLVKASAGGGGKGMRVVEGPDGLAAALAAAKREAKAAFGDGRLLLEKYLSRPRHIEMQVFADGHGNAVHLFERDCSIQRRHQKVIEEAPAPGMTAGRRAEMGAAAVAAARAIDYRGAGTVEFIAEGDAFYFIEMNTRLQVEHPVTEMITGLDLVEWQLRVAAGEPLPLGQEDVTLRGHAFEARLYAEDPRRDFLPATGRLQHLRMPLSGRHVRVETGVRQGDTVTIHYDPMIAKIVAWDHDRDAALRRLRAALGEVQVLGVTSNAAFLAAVAAHPAFAKGKVHTGFIDQHAKALLPPPAPVPDTVLALAVLELLLARAEAAAAQAFASSEPWSPWHAVDGWRLNGAGQVTLRLDDDDRQIAVRIHYRPDGYVLELPGGPVSARASRGAGGGLRAVLDGRHVGATVIRRDREINLFLEGGPYRLVLHDPIAAAAKQTEGGALTAPMPGRIAAIHVKAGTEVHRGQPLLVLEAMKMEHSIVAPDDGVVESLPYAVDEQVEEGARLVEFKTAGATP